MLLSLHGRGKTENLFVDYFQTSSSSKDTISPGLSPPETSGRLFGVMTYVKVYIFTFLALEIEAYKILIFIDLLFSSFCIETVDKMSF